MVNINKRLFKDTFQGVIYGLKAIKKEIQHLSNSNSRWRQSLVGFRLKGWLTHLALKTWAVECRSETNDLTIVFINELVIKSEMSEYSEKCPEQDYLHSLIIWFLTAC